MSGVVAPVSMKETIVTGLPNRLPSVFAVVLNTNRADDTIKCVRSLRESGYDNLGVVVVDNASRDGSPEIIQAAIPDLPVLRQQMNGGYSVGNNVGVRYALQRKPDYILVINEDAFVEKGFLLPMISMMLRDPLIGVVNAKVFYQSNPTEIFSAVGEFSRWLCTGLNVGRNAAALKSTTLECEVDYVCGVLLLVRREVFETIGLFEERFFMYFDDIDFSLRVRKKYKLAYTARAVAYHKSGGGKGWRSYTELYLYYHTRNRIWMFQDESAWYRVYVAVFTFANAMAKAAVISLNIFKEPRRMFKQWKAISLGLVDGLTGRSRTTYGPW